MFFRQCFSAFCTFAILIDKLEVLLCRLPCMQTIGFIDLFNSSSLYYRCLLVCITSHTRDVTQRRYPKLTPEFHISARFVHLFVKLSYTDWTVGFLEMEDWTAVATPLFFPSFLANLLSNGTSTSLDVREEFRRKTATINAVCGTLVYNADCLLEVAPDNTSSVSIILQKCQSKKMLAKTRTIRSECYFLTFTAFSRRYNQISSLVGVLFQTTVFISTSTLWMSVWVLFSNLTRQFHFIKLNCFRFRFPNGALTFQSETSQIKNTQKVWQSAF